MLLKIMTELPKAQEETQEPERTANTLEELLKLIQTVEEKSGFFLVIISSARMSSHRATDGIFRELIKRQPLKQLAVKLSDCRREIAFFESNNGNENASEHVVKYVERGELTLAN
ncbi:hypothetical protein Ae201684P_010569 [Aphanomyces euteiches]|nr:hypothetical protein Ae201684P_010569 [Aphanomyces euteiches]